MTSLLPTPNGEEPFNLYWVEEPGMAWLMDNYEKLNLGSSRKANASPRRGGPSVPLDDDIPF